MYCRYSKTTHLNSHIFQLWNPNLNLNPKKGQPGMRLLSRWVIKGNWHLCKQINKKMFVCYYEVHRNLNSFIYENFTFIPVCFFKFFMYPSWQSSMIQFSQICLLQIIKGKRLNISIYIWLPIWAMYRNLTILKYLFGF